MKTKNVLTALTSTLLLATSAEMALNAQSAQPYQGVAGRTLAESKEWWPEPAKAPAGGYTVQVASYKTEKGAQREASTLKQKGYHDVFVVQKGTYVILCVGNFQRKEEASLLGKKLMGRYQDLRVRSL